VLIANVDVGGSKDEWVLPGRWTGVQDWLFAIDWRVLILLEVEIRRHDTSYHVVHTVFRYRAIVDGLRYVAAEERGVRGSTNAAWKFTLEGMTMTVTKHQGAQHTRHIHI